MAPGPSRISAFETQPHQHNPHLSSLFSLLASLAAARPGKVQTLMQYRCSSVVDYFHKGLPAFVCALPASQFSSFHFYYIPLCVRNMGKCKPLQLLSLLLLLASAVAAAFSCYRSLQQKGRALVDDDSSRAPTAVAFDSDLLPRVWALSLDEVHCDSNPLLGGARSM